MDADFARDLDRFLDASGSSRERYTVESTLKESESECTELVRDAEGRRWVRKLFLRDDPTIADSYRTMQKAASPYLPRIHDLQHSTAGTVVVREYFAGPTLRAWVERYGALDEHTARSTLLAICRSVQALHSCKPALIHRDINPSNVIVGIDGPHLVDFGIARSYDESASRDTHAWGTTGYAAPEQFGFDQSDARTDVFALGMLYWFMLTGTDPEANLGARLRQDPSGISKSARTVIQNCVALAPEARYTDVGALERALGGAGQMPAPPEAPAAEKRPATGASLMRKALSKAWFAISTAFMALLALVIIVTLLDPWRLSVPEGWAHALVFCLGLLMMFAPAWLLTTNLFGIRDKLPFLQRGTAIRCMVIIIVSFILGAVVANAATQDLPAAYVQLMQQHGQSTI